MNNLRALNLDPAKALANRGLNLALYRVRLVTRDSSLAFHLGVAKAPRPGRRPSHRHRPRRHHCRRQRLLPRHYIQSPIVLITVVSVVRGCLIGTRSRGVVGVRVGVGGGLIGAGARGVERERRVLVLIGAEAGVVGVGARVVVVVGAIEVGHGKPARERKKCKD